MFNQFKFFCLISLLVTSSLALANETLSPTEKLQRILRDRNYFDNNIKNIIYYYGEMVTINFNDGRKTNIGLIPRWQSEKLDGVDCETPAYDIYFAAEPDGYGFFTRKDLELLRDSGPVGQSFLDVATRIEFTKEKSSQKTFPTFINQKTAPNFCQTHNLAKRRWEQCFPFCGLF